MPKVPRECPDHPDCLGCLESRACPECLHFGQLSRCIVECSRCLACPKRPLPSTSSEVTAASAVSTVSLSTPFSLSTMAQAAARSIDIPTCPHAFCKGIARTSDPTPWSHYKDSRTSTLANISSVSRVPWVAHVFYVSAVSEASGVSRVSAVSQQEHIPLRPLQRLHSAFAV